MDITNATGEDVGYRIEDGGRATFCRGSQHRGTLNFTGRAVCRVCDRAFTPVYFDGIASGAGVVPIHAAGHHLLQEEQAEREFCAAEARPDLAALRAEHDRINGSPLGSLRPEQERRLGELREALAGTPYMPWSREQDAYDAQVEAIVRGFLIPACQYRPAEGEKYDPHAQWKLVAFAGGVIAGWVSSFDPELMDRTRVAQHMTNDCRKALLAADLAKEFWTARLKIASPKGLPPRVAEALLRLGVNR